MPGQARVLAAGLTDVGRKRNHNEDNFAIVDDEHLYLVADGMGGHASGEVAVAMAVDTLSEFFSRPRPIPRRPGPTRWTRRAATRRTG